jgi:3-hydroxyacyl-CoA dehydrogenase
MPDAASKHVSSFSITSLAAGMKHPSAHRRHAFFNPAPILPLVEVRGAASADLIRAVAELV